MFGKMMRFHKGTTVSYDIEPFTAYEKFTTDSAYPHAHSPLPVRVPTLRVLLQTFLIP